MVFDVHLDQSIQRGRSVESGTNGPRRQGPLRERVAVKDRGV